MVKVQAAMGARMKGAGGVYEPSSGIDTDGIGTSESKKESDGTSTGEAWKLDRGTSKDDNKNEKHQERGMGARQQHRHWRYRC